MRNIPSLSAKEYIHRNNTDVFEEKVIVEMKKIKGKAMHRQYGDYRLLQILQGFFYRSVKPGIRLNVLCHIHEISDIIKKK